MPYIYCPEKKQIFHGWKSPEDNVGYNFPGIYVKNNFLSKDECLNVMIEIDNQPWQKSQSGRRKQNYGPKTNFKKRKLQLGLFQGFPKFSSFIQERFDTIPILKNYQTIEQCSLEYDPINGASIEPHIDDAWIWGERVVTVNCLGDSYLTLTRYKGDKSKYNLNCVDEYSNDLLKCDKSLLPDDIVVRIPMLEGSLIVMYGEARYEWEHCVLREDIEERRVCIAYREFTPPYLNVDNHDTISYEVLNRAKQFWK